MGCLPTKILDKFKYVIFIKVCNLSSLKGLWYDDMRYLRNISHVKVNSGVSDIK